MRRKNTLKKSLQTKYYIVDNAIASIIIFNENYSRDDRFFVVLKDIFLTNFKNVIHLLRSISLIFDSYVYQLY